MANSYLNEYNTIAEMNTAYEEGHDESWVAYCAEDNSLYYQQKTKIASKYFDNLEYNSENKTLEFYIDGDLKKSIDVSPWWFEKDSYYTREETNELLNTKFDSVKYDSSARTINFYVGEEIKNSIDATDFIKDGMVNTVTVEVISGVSYLAITFNEDEEGKKTHDTIYLELTKIFNPENYYTKTVSDSKYVNAIGTSGNNLTYTIGDNTNNLTVPYANSAPWSGISNTPTTRDEYGITDLYLKSEMDGVYIAYWDTGDVSMNGQNSLLYMCNPKKWVEEGYNNKSYVKPIGVAFSYNGYRRIVALSGATNQLVCPSMYIDHSGVWTRDFTTALNDMTNGLSITSSICTNHTETTTDYAFGYCWNYDPGYSSKRINNWYLPTLGELWSIYNNYNKINYALSVITNAQQIPGGSHHCSTRCIGSDFWSLTFYNGIIHGLYNYISTAQYNVRPITSF